MTNDKIKIYKAVFIKTIDKQVKGLGYLVSNSQCEFSKNEFKAHVESYISNALYECHNLYPDCQITNEMSVFLINIIRGYVNCKNNFTNFLSEYNELKFTFMYNRIKNIR